MRFSIKAKIAILCGMFLFIFIPSTLFLMKNLTKIIKISRDTHNTFECVVAKSQNLIKHIVDMETGQRGFIITGKDEFLEPYKKAVKNFVGTLSHLRKDLSNHPKYLKMLEEIEHIQYEWIGVAGEPEINMRRVINEAQFSLKSIDEMVRTGKGKKIIDKTRAIISTMSKDFQKSGRKDNLLLTTQIGKDIVDSECGERGFLLAGRDWFLEPFYNGQIKFYKHTKELEKILQGDKKNLERLSNLKKLYEEWLAEVARPEIHARIRYEKAPRSMDDITNLLAAGTGKKILDELRNLIDEFTNTLTKDIEQKVSQSERTVTEIKIISFAVCSVGILLSLIFSFIIGRSIINPINTLIAGTYIIGNGDLTHKINLRNKDELAILADSFNKMSEGLQKAIVKRDQEITVRMKREEELRESKIRRDSEIRLAATLESIGDAVITIDMENKIALMNPMAEALTGWRYAEAKGKDIQEIFNVINEKIRKAIEDPVQKVFRERRIIELSNDSVLIPKGGNEYPIAASAAPIITSQGDHIGVVLVFRDITEKRKAENELKKALAKAEESDRLKSAFLANMSHEIRTPLNPILGYTDLMLEDELSDEHRENLETIKESVNLLLAIINDILDLSKIEAGQIEVEQVPLSLESIFKNVNSNYKTVITHKQKDITLRENYPDNISKSIIADPTRLQQIMNNLVSNAVKFTDSGFIEYGVRLRDENKLEFYVRDTGIGIAEDKQEEIFRPFLQADVSHTRKYGGTGLGLTISKKLVELLGGEIKVTSNVVSSHGTTFYFTIPYKPIETETKNLKEYAVVKSRSS